MKKILFSICALALSITASAQEIITEQPQGKLIDNMYRSSKAFVKKGWIGVEAGKYEGLTSKIVEATDGSLYVYNPLSGLDSKSWMKLEKVSEGNYKAKFPQAIYKDNYGGDDEDESASTERIFTLNLMTKNNKDKYEVVASNLNSIDFTWDGKTLTMKNMGTSAKILGMAFKDKWNDQYGAWTMTITSTDDKLITPPANATNQQYIVSSKSNNSVRIIDAATEGNDIYLKGLFKSQKLADKWIKLTKQDNKAILKTNQYLGTGKKEDLNSKGYSSDKSEYHVYAAAFNDATNDAEELVFDIDATTGKLSNDKILKISLGKGSKDNLSDEELESMEGLTLTPYVEKDGKPATPTFDYCSATEDYYDETKINTILSFNVKNADVDGNYLNPEKMYYNVYFNDSAEPFKFTKGTYTKINKEELINIPFTFQDSPYSPDFRVLGDKRILHFYENNITSIKVVMVYTGKDGKTYSSDPMIARPNTNTGIESATFNKTATEKYYTIDGRQIQQLQKGLNIIKSSNGTTRKVIVK
nr:hypothetical protein [uncultured Prevotella sp.]